MKIPKLWSDGWDYNDITDGYPEWWKVDSRNNKYTFYSIDGKERRLIDIINKYNIRSILDYGSGNSSSIRITLTSCNRQDILLEEYDPFVPGKEIRPDKTFDLVVCHNVLGGIEKEYVSSVVDDLLNYSNKIVLIKIPTRKEWMEFFVNSVTKVKNKRVLEFSLYEANEKLDTSVFIKLSDFYIYFLLEKYEQPDEKHEH